MTPKIFASEKLKRVESHFQFGVNWASFSQLLDAQRIEHAVNSLRELIGAKIAGRSFLDVGSGSGLSALAAARLGASPILAVDIDSDSVITTRDTLARHAPNCASSVLERSI